VAAAGLVVITACAPGQEAADTGGGLDGEVAVAGITSLIVYDDGNGYYTFVLLDDNLGYVEGEGATGTQPGSAAIFSLWLDGAPDGAYQFVAGAGTPGVLNAIVYRDFYIDEVDGPTGEFYFGSLSSASTGTANITLDGQQQQMTVSFDLTLDKVDLDTYAVLGRFRVTGSYVGGWFSGGGG